MFIRVFIPVAKTTWCLPAVLLYWWISCQKTMLQHVLIFCCWSYLLHYFDCRLGCYATGLCRAGTTFRHTGMGRPYWNRHKARRKSESEKRLVCEKYLHIRYITLQLKCTSVCVYDINFGFWFDSTMTLTEEIRRCLRMPTFDNWQWEDEEILLLLQQMYIDLDLTRKFDIDLNVLRKFLCQVYMNYNEVPFHNFQHCFTVSQMVRNAFHSYFFLSIWNTKRKDLISMRSM